MQVRYLILLFVTEEQPINSLLLDLDLSDAKPISLKGVNDFTEVGKGKCVDDSNRSYSYVRSRYMSKADDCYNWCLQEPENGFVGIDIYRYQSGAGLCDCLFSDRGADHVSIIDYNPTASVSDSWPSGSGAIQSSSGYPYSSKTCYSYNVSFNVKPPSSLS